jgi:hypothetical protein
MPTPQLIDSSCKGALPEDAQVLIRVALLFLALLLLPVPLAAQDAGLLLGVEIAQDSEEAWQRQPQLLRTYWIVGNARGAELKAVLPALLVPQEDRFLRAAIRRSCGRDPDHGYSFCRDDYWTGPAPEGPPAPPSAEAFDEDGPCAYETLRIHFLSAVAVALWRHAGNSETCEPRGYQWSESTWLQPVTGVAQIRLSEVAGEAAVQACAAAASHAEAELAKEIDATCEADRTADERWTILRRAGAWHPQLAQENGPGWCYLSAEIAASLPTSFTGPDRLAFPWDELAAAIPGLRDAVSSPDGSWTVALTGSELIFVPDTPRARRVITTVQSLRVVMAQWAVGQQVARWSEAVTGVR